VLTTDSSLNNRLGNKNGIHQNLKNCKYFPENQKRRYIMINILKKKNGMDIVGQGGKIILFMLPSLIVAILLHKYLPQFSALPESISFVKPVGYLLLFLGLILWGTAVIQLISGFSKGKLVTTGAYGIVRNPIYSSATFFIFPAVSLLTFTWVYFLASVFLYIGVMIFIGKEEKQLMKVFGKEYEDYKTRVDRLIPFKKPSP
jgi:protein-S-isoprenylcysteine O-methyltransferase Ste14